MLTREQAQEQLPRYRGDGQAPRSFGCFVLAGAPARQLDAWLTDRRQGDPQVLAQQLDELGERKLARVFGALVPALGEPLARWWHWARDAPYQIGWERRGFRSSSAADSYAARMHALGGLISLGREWPQQPGWFAAWSIHLGGPSPALAGLLASEITNGRTDIADTLIACAFGRHPVGGITQVGLQALLGSDRPQCWEAVATLLRNAGRQEGLRSTVLEAADLAHPAALRHLLEVVAEEDLTRFAGTVRAIGVWFGEELPVRKGDALRTVVADLARLLGEDAPCPPRDDPRQAYLTLWTLAIRDARRAIAAATELLASPDPDTRRAAARLLAELGLPAARAVLRPHLADEALPVYATVISAWPSHPDARDSDARLTDVDVTALLARVQTLGQPVEIDTGLVGTRIVRTGSTQAADLIIAASPAAAPPAALAAASSDGRYIAALRLAKDPQPNRAALFAMLRDPAADVRARVFEALSTLPSITGEEAAQLEDALRRKAADLRRACLTLLLHQPAEQIAASVRRLADGTAEQARAATELAGRAGIPQAGGAPPRPAGDDPAEALRLRAADRTPARRPELPPPGRFMPYHHGCRLIVTSLRAWLAEHADVEVSTPRGVELLANVRWLGAVPPGATLPLPEILEPWWERTVRALTDGGVELALLHLAIPERGAAWARDAVPDVLGAIPADAGEPRLIWAIIHRLAVLEFRPSWVDPLLDAAARIWHELPVTELMGVPEVMARRGRRVETDQWGHITGADARAAFADVAGMLPLADLDTAQLGRLWRLVRFLDEPEGTFDEVDGQRVPAQAPRSFAPGSEAGELLVPDQPFRARPAAELVARAFDAGIARRGDLVDVLRADTDPVNNPWGSQRFVGGRHRAGIGPFTARRLPPWASSPGVQAVVGDVRDAAIAGELARGDFPVALSQTAAALRSAYGVRSLAAVLAALGRRPLTRGYSWTASRDSALSHLARIHQPGQGEGVAELREAFAAAPIGRKRVIEFGVYAPHWAALIERYLDWPGFESAVWWVHAHTKDDSWRVDAQIRDEWAAAVAQRTPLDATDLTRGAADVAWFHAVIGELGEDRFDQVLAASRYASSSGGHKRAELFARALLGRAAEAEVAERMRVKRHQDSVRALGLLPVDGGDDPAVLDRYETLRAFVASDRTSGSQRRASETTAVAIGLENLARSAGYRDPQRLVWAMEARAVRDLAGDGISATDGDLTVTLAIDAAGRPATTVQRAGKRLKSIPASSAKVPEIAALKACATELRKQAARMRASLEAACVTGDASEPAEIDELLRHPVIAPMLRELVLVSAEGVMGFASGDSGTLLGPDGVPRPTDGSPLRIAHPVDLLAGEQWAPFQDAVFRDRRTQPFRQLFRELYLPTASEREDGPASRRYAGHQVEEGRSAGIFTSRGWVSDFEVGFGRTFHREKITAWCSLLQGFGTAAEVEDATVEDVTFCRAGEWDPIPIGDVPPRVFSETMRDLDLVVSVAHSGGVDPETSESSIEMRRRLVEQTADMLGLDNVEITGHHARIRGTLGSYSVQLGSGQVHRLPGNAVCIIPVSAQHRGRIFLPFADDDPRTAEVISKVVLLARDDKIQDPTILEQLA